MATDDPSDTITPAPKAGSGINDRPAEDIISVNARGRRQSGKLTPFFAMGGVALVVLIAGLATVNVVRAKLSGPKPTPAPSAATPAGLARNFDIDQAPPLPGAASASAGGAAAGTQAGAEPACPDGSVGNELKGRDGVVVRNADGQSVRVCPNGQVVGVGAPERAAKAIPVAGPYQRVQTASSGPQSAVYGSSRPTGAMDGSMMLNGGKYGSAAVLSDPQAALAATQQAVIPTPPKAEGLLTASSANALEAELTPSKTPMVQAARLSDLNMLLPKGRTIDCGMSMRIISSLAGQASCVVTSSVFSANGKVVLIERGSEAVGEYRSEASVGQKRLFVLWTSIRTPGGIVINLNSPGADELGATGLTGNVDGRWWERVGSAFLLSTIQDAISYEVAQDQTKSNSQMLVLSNTAQTGNTMAQKVLESTINIPPTIYKNQGDRAVIYVARDLDFSNVYTLRAKP